MAHVGGFGIKILTKAEEKAKWRLVLQLAEEKKNVEAMIKALVAISELQRGRPYVATNPSLGAGIVQDPRLTAHIKNLIPSVTVNMTKPEPKQIEATIVSPLEDQASQADSSLGGPSDD